MHWRGDGVVKDSRLALNAYNLACSFKDASSCMFLGDWYEKSEHNHSTARQYYSEACAAGNKNGCRLARAVPVGRDEP
jgi:TPR repeat protein